MGVWGPGVGVTSIISDEMSLLVLVVLVVASSTPVDGRMTTRATPLRRSGRSLKGGDSSVHGGSVCNNAIFGTTLCEGSGKKKHAGCT